MKTKQKLIDAYRHLLLKHGQESFTLLEVCKEANISSKATFYHYFHTKSDLLEVLATDLTHDIIDKLCNIKIHQYPIEEQIEIIVDIFIQTSIKTQELIIEITKQLEVNKNLKRLANNYENLFIALTEILFDKVNEQNLFKSRLVMSIIGQYISEEVVENSYITKSSHPLTKKKIIYSFILSMIR